VVIASLAVREADGPDSVEPDMVTDDKEPTPPSSRNARSSKPGAASSAGFRELGQVCGLLGMKELPVIEAFEGRGELNRKRSEAA
jgi:hypothetical protein